ncbi:5106_t:CDS:2, partial [Diversispora eburnea]
MTSSNLNKNGSHNNLTNSMHKTRNRPKPLSHNSRQTLGVSHLPTPSPTPKSPCFVHSNLNRSFSLSEIINNCDDKLTEYSNLAETAVSVRELSKKLGQAQIQIGMQTVMIVTKPGNLRLVNLTRKLAIYLITTPRFGKDHGVTVYVDKALKDVKQFDFQGILEEKPLAKDYLKFWTKELCAERPEIFNFVLTLGGDGTVLYTSWLFQKVVPPILPFHLGSLGFLTNFNIQNYKEHLTNAMEKGIRVNLRMRFTCTVYRRIINPDNIIKARRCGETGEILMQNFMNDGSYWEALENSSHSDTAHKCSHDKDLPLLITQPVESFEVLNDLVVDRGAGPYM